ncbi:MAG: inositol-3-phosphate synthase [Myxococcota bacterium]|nr:inositol-3-phosphate synthase [Myxococcota bacterium]
MSRLGVLIVGVNGAVSSTLIAGVELMIRGRVPRIGMGTEPTEAKISESITGLLDLVPLENLVFGGWDVRFPNVYEGALHHKVFPQEVLAEVRDKLEATTPWPAVFNRAYAQNVEGTHAVEVSSHRQELALLRRNIQDFKRTRGVERLVMVNLASTEAYLEQGPVHASRAAFEAGLDRSDPAISPAMRYFYAAAELGIPYCNFTPSHTNIPALSELAGRTQTPYAGMDGKTGQTLVKTALAAMMRVRRLKIEGWYSTNVLGNNDGLVLDAPESNKTKVLSKSSVLDSVVGYHVDNHQVHIHYYKPRGDSKEAWDNIDVVGFGGLPMQIKVNFLCQDSALAAPLVIDLVRLLDVAKRAGESGIQRQLSLFFKSPFHRPGEAPIHDLFKQEQLLLEWARERSVRPHSIHGDVARTHGDLDVAKVEGGLAGSPLRVWPEVRASEGRRVDRNGSPE